MPASDPTPPALQQKHSLAWVEACNEFRRRERQEIFLQDPPREKLARYELELKFFIRSARMLISMAEDPDFPAKQFIPELEGKLLQLNESLEMLHNPMTAAEADAFIQKYFPDDAPVGKTA
ncbi:MAG: hypothetical protein C5B50_16595 [Verrucomicrobia bacterium]|nr:MAG: hypothetical protein C5B50_16595 [Verrucomicrobiota bacterium]